MTRLSRSNFMYKSWNCDSNGSLWALYSIYGVATFLLPGALAHSEEHDPHGYTHQGHDNGTSKYPDTYFTLSEHAGIMYAHIITMTIAWTFILPVGVMLALARSRHRLFAQCLFFTLNALGVALAISYNKLTPNLYPNNAHHKIGWIITLVSTVEISIIFLSRVVQIFTGRTKVRQDEPGHPLMSVTLQDLGPVEGSLDRSSSSHSTGYGSETDVGSLQGDGDDKSDKSYIDMDDEVEGTLLPLLHSYPRLSSQVTRLVPFTFWKYSIAVLRIFNYMILPFGSVAIATGIVTYGRLFEGHTMFGGLAHWIKGGVFVWLGLFTLGRWCGSFAELGWAWNIRPSREEAWRPSAEFIESALICFYGCTNIFLEHISAWGGRWTGRDLEHVAITVLFIGGGALGMLIESKWIRELLDTSIRHKTSDLYLNKLDHEQHQSSARSYNFSLNPIPALVILLLGVMMSSHQQSTMMGTMLHTQWGSLLSYASLARALTYVIIYLKPPTSIFSSRIPTELLTSLGLISGGIIFMASSDDTIQAMIYHELDPMFMYTVTMGLVGLLMAWEVALLAFKGWIVRNELRLNDVQPSDIAMCDQI